MPTINIEFYTEKINRKLCQAGILEFLFSHVNRDDIGKANLINQWTIKIYPVSEKANDADWKNINGKISGNIPYGITDVEHKVCKIWVNDSPNDLIFLQNFMTISHELSHVLLSIFYPNKKGVYRHDDKSWGRKGKTAHFYTTEVHDREYEMSHEHKWIRRLIVHFETKNKIKSYSFPCFDLTDLTDTRMVNR
ncbi:MAG: hypothetical protein HZC29_01095 [Thaumarchaeota archaeon]|nr:hypothetical protein [Nitrososphaerota archaeon]